MPDHRPHHSYPSILYILVLLTHPIMKTRLSLLSMVLTHLFVSSPVLANDSELPFQIATVAEFDEPWAMTFLPNGTLLVTEKAGSLFAVSQSGTISAPVTGLPEIAYGGQGGLGDITLHPNFESNQLVYFSYAESNNKRKYGAVVARAKLVLSDQASGKLEDIDVVWRQTPKVSGKGHYGHRIAFDDRGYLFISSGERQKFDPAQDMTSTLGKIIRLHDDGSIPQDNPFVDDGSIRSEIWSSGHRNPLGLAFDKQGRLWNSEMGPLHGDELNLVKPGKNYGYPIVSNGNHYSGKKIPNHDTRPEFEAPKVWWKPTIAPAELIYYSGDMFAEWRNSFLIAGLRPRAIIRVSVSGDNAQEVERFKMDRRIRELEQGPDGAIWVLEDGSSAALLRLSR